MLNAELLTCTDLLRFVLSQIHASYVCGVVDDVLCVEFRIRGEVQMVGLSAGLTPE